MQLLKPFALSNMRMSRRWWLPAGDKYARWTGSPFSGEKQRRFFVADYTQSEESLEHKRQAVGPVQQGIRTEEA